jgi:hypothetical protein
MYLAWCLIGVEGRLSLSGEDQLDNNGDLDDGKTYYYIQMRMMTMVSFLS